MLSSWSRSWIVVLGAALVCLAPGSARAWDADVDSTEIVAPFASPELTSALEALRRHRIAVNTGLAAPADALTDAGTALRGGLDDGVDDPAAVTLLALRVFIERGDATAATATAAVAAMIHPAIDDELWLLHAELAHRAGMSPTPALLDDRAAIAELEPGRLAHVQALEALHRADPSAAALTLAGALAEVDVEAVGPLCALGVEVLPAVATAASGAALARRLETSCAGEPASVGAALVRRMMGHLASLASPVVAAAWGAPLAPQERLRAAQRLYTRVQHDDVIAVLAPLVDDSTIELDSRCEALWRTAMTWRRSRRASQSRAPYATMTQVCEALPEWHARALYGLAWNDFRDGAWDEARAGLDALIESQPASRYADDAVYYQVQIAVAQDDAAAAAAAVEPLLSGELALGDLGGDALWRYIEMLDGDARVSLLDRAHAVLDADPSYFSQGRVAYARAPGTEAPTEALLEVAERFPLTFYAYLAVSELEARASTEDEAAAEALASWQADVALARQPARALTFAPLPEHDAVERARAWWAAGWSAQAARALERTPLEGEAARWVAALGHHLEGHYARSHDIARREIEGWQLRMPDPTNRLLWEIAYPRPYPEVVEGAASEAQIPASMVWAIMREESGFRPRVESYAHAIGLMQLLESTGSSHARRALGLDGVDAEALREPTLNIRVGAAFLGHLATRLAPHTVLMAAGYNAGRGAVNKWLKSRGSLALHAFAEAIPYEQTRNYSKRVNSSVLVYEVLYGTDEVPMLRLDDVAGGDREALVR